MFRKFFQSFEKFKKQITKQKNCNVFFNVCNDTKPTTAFFVGSVGAVRIVVALVTSVNAAAISTLELLTPACRFGHWRRLRGFKKLFEF